MFRGCFSCLAWLSRAAPPTYGLCSATAFCSNISFSTNWGSDSSCRAKARPEVAFHQHPAKNVRATGMYLALCRWAKPGRGPEASSGTCPVGFDAEMGRCPHCAPGLPPQHPSRRSCAHEQPHTAGRSVSQPAQPLGAHLLQLCDVSFRHIFNLGAFLQGVQGSFLRASGSLLVSPSPAFSVCVLLRGLMGRAMGLVSELGRGRNLMGHHDMGRARSRSIPSDLPHEKSLFYFCL